MTREQIKEQFPDATEEQITAILNINGTDLTEAKKKNVDPKVLKQLQDDSAAYKKLQEAGLTDEEKIQKALDDAAASKIDFQKKSNRLEVEKILVAAGLTEDDYKDVIDGLVSEDAEKSKNLATNLAAMLSKQKESAVQKTKEELMDGTKGGNGGGTDGSSGADEKTDDVKNVESISFGSVSKEAQAARDYYK
ncbi:MAG: hypothetical protein HDQ97_00375 [Lachnospiraceae bacterium]|nr:hypothetical protein [Lachnospiraceae bacterium]